MLLPGCVELSGVSCPRCGGEGSAAARDVGSRVSPAGGGEGLGGRPQSQPALLSEARQVLLR